MSPDFRGLITKCALLLVLVGAIAACSSRERPYRSGYQHRTVSGSELGFKRVSVKLDPMTAVETVRLEEIPLEVRQRRYYRKYRKRRDHYGKWRTRERRQKGKEKPASGIQVALSSVSGGLSAKFAGNRGGTGVTTNSDGVVVIRSTLKHAFTVFADAPLESVIRHPAILDLDIPESARKREWYRLTAGQKPSGSGGQSRSTGNFTYKSTHATYDIRPVLRRIARLVHADKTAVVRIVPANIDSRYPFNNASITLSPQGSVEVDPRNWLRKHLKHNEHLSYAARHFPGFVRKKASRHSGRNGATFRVAPGPHLITVTHPGYFYFEKTIELSRSRKEVMVLMSALGTKHRVKIIH